MSIQLPNDTQRLVIVGATGSGKTQAATWHLSKRSFTEMPWIVYDFKGDELLNSIEHAQHMTSGMDIPTRPGLYIVHADPEDSGVESQLMQIWKQQNTGLYIDEGYMIDRNSKPFSLVLTQGRSRHIPCITLSQRPVWMNRFVFSEADYFQIFRLGWIKDIRKVQEYTGDKDITVRLPDYYSYYYDVSSDSMKVLKPVPDRETILDTFNYRLRGLPKVV